MDWFERHPKLTIVLLLGVISATIVFSVRKYRASTIRPESQIWWYNLKTGQLFPDLDTKVPPIDTESGPGTGVKAYVVSCGDCADPKQRVIAYLEMMTPEGKREVEAQMKGQEANAPIGMAIEKNQGSVLVKLPASEEWVSKFSAEGAGLMEAGRRSAGCAQPALCLP